MSFLEALQQCLTPEEKVNFYLQVIDELINSHKCGDKIFETTHLAYEKDPMNFDSLISFDNWIDYCAAGSSLKAALQYFENKINDHETKVGASFGAIDNLYGFFLSDGKTVKSRVFNVVK